MTIQRARGIALALAALILVADQATKLWVLHRADFSQGPIALLPFMDITLVWNRGISYGLFQADGAGRWVLVGLTMAGIVGLGVWLMRTGAPLVALGVGVILGGAAGNLIDRVAYGAVVDFVHLNAGGYSWYVFNIADAAIVVGVVLLMWDAFFAKKPQTPS
ncbi:signal peptidase II [Acuticoccus sp. MNP-M23]|uniref:signal peptidase II n=1 Tax=Acuticoccus sp. MNP-M23 TaxID=3072793 RepID=UPI0028163DC0|nr:signal peptidase II [Acuticoccus sp. MNP-M23]WMS44850.1 signal peptidase II [Acuticoccus sp. MNP-M23]